MYVKSHKRKIKRALNLASTRELESVAHAISCGFQNKTSDLEYINKNKF